MGTPGTRADLAIRREEHECGHVALALDEARAPGHSRLCCLWPLLPQQLHEGFAALHVVRVACALHPTGHIYAVPEEAEASVEGSHNCPHNSPRMYASSDVDAAKLWSARADRLCVCRSVAPEGEISHVGRMSAWQEVLDV
eukprot:CAMPEP_0202339518 /NCGR_PEP_ID=MMETSP1126-20121109/1343_1 /ASSEMBLY_ACC=CAM_ASM_000457 /TAXON_ID=3047 /ORGANISM="Dunaliella tertiolecta, Strain CCMP1320" /LENGTH=140 /DNA_ID=CAMNT_0048930075 /DNA_START=227 /DNA_END=649 /DNA_ORIENTATION=-